MNFKPSLWKVIVSLVFALPVGYSLGRPGFRFDIGNFLIIFIPLFIFVYLVGSLVEKNKV